MSRSLDAERDLRQRLERFVRKHAPSYFSDQIDDLVQIAAMRLIRGNPDWTWENALLDRIAYCVVIDEIRRQNRRAEVAFTPSMPERLANSADLAPDTRVHGTRIGRAIMDALARLSPARRQAMTLYLQGHKPAEVAAILGWDAKRASNAITRGKQDLQQHLRSMGLAA